MHDRAGTLPRALPPPQVRHLVTGLVVRAAYDPIEGGLVVAVQIKQFFLLVNAA